MFTVYNLVVCVSSALLQSLVAEESWGRYEVMELLLLTVLSKCLVNLWRWTRVSVYLL